MKKIVLLLNISIVMLLVSCKQQDKTDVTGEPVKVKERHQPKKLSYRLENTKEWLSKNNTDSTQLHIAYAVNRTDGANFKNMGSVVIPDDMSGDIEFYLPFPLEVSSLKEINKIIFFSYPTQTFAAYEKGQLVYTGPTNMGRKKDLTPTGLFYTNWKAEQTTSTFDDEWDLRWNFNIENKLGVGWHQYTLPGYPASHSCLRLQEKDARNLYDWADQWELADEENVKVKGTPVIVFGAYNFSAPKPWLQLATNPKALDISENEIEKVTLPFLSSILKEQKNRQSFQDSKK
ncbi:hypothetical protein H4V97_002728 [Flavobacterium sp. CG_23.5]|uniref:L,D-transpeptidase n=1 Tax=Flavobacterium sp. CG_23.5 TaxID=2760708 RepID=UPI001AEAEC62|nr:L,D-transpeptidase [Flavobacterium sp. CG_23.5]MBP2284410.1 hypothetical protein [Flavobacterium sp. CG_23.5]